MDYLKDATKTHTKNVEAQYTTEEFFYDNSFEDYVEIRGRHRKKQHVLVSEIIDSLFVFCTNQFDADSGVISGPELLQIFSENDKFSKFYEFSECIVKIVDSPVFNSYTIDYENGNQLMNKMQAVDIYDFQDVWIGEQFTGIFFLYSIQYLTYDNGIKHLRVRGKEINDEYDIMLMHSTLDE